MINQGCDLRYKVNSRQFCEITQDPLAQMKFRPNIRSIGPNHGNKSFVLFHFKNIFNQNSIDGLSRGSEKLIMMIRSIIITAKLSLLEVHT